MNGEWKNLSVEGAEEDGGREKLMRIAGAGVDCTNISRSSRSQQRGEKRLGVSSAGSEYKCMNGS